MIGRTLIHHVLEGLAKDALRVRCAVRHHEGDAFGAMDTMAAYSVHGDDAEQRDYDESKAVGLHQ